MLPYSSLPAGHAAVLMPGSLPLWTTLLAALVLRDRITPGRAFGLALIVAGDLMVASSLLHAFEGGEVWKGDLLHGREFSAGPATAWWHAAMGSTPCARPLPLPCSHC